MSNRNRVLVATIQHRGNKLNNTAMHLSCFLLSCFPLSGCTCKTSVAPISTKIKRPAPSTYVCSHTGKYSIQRSELRMFSNSPQMLFWFRRCRVNSGSSAIESDKIQSFFPARTSTLWWYFGETPQSLHRDNNSKFKNCCDQ